MIILRLLDHDLHRSKRGIQATPLHLDVPAKSSFLPAIVSLSTPRFVVARKLTAQGNLRSGIFDYDSDRIDEVLPDLLTEAYKLSVDQGWSNVFKKPEQAVEYIQKQSGTTSQPHHVLIPSGWSDAALTKWVGKKNLSIFTGKDIADSAFADSSMTVLYRVCRVQRAKVTMPVFFSRPDFVGMYTQFLGGKSSIFLHNVRSGLAFCP